MAYSDIVKKRIRQTFDHVNNHRWDEAVKAVAPRVHHRVSGAHALGGERHDKKALRRWFERLGRVLPTLHLTIDHIWVTGWPWHTTVFAQWDGSATLLSGDASEGALVGQLRAVPAVPGRARMLTRDGYHLVQVGWTPSVHGA